MAVDRAGRGDEERGVGPADLVVLAERALRRGQLALVAELELDEPGRQLRP